MGAPRSGAKRKPPDMAFDFKKEYGAFCLPGDKPEIVTPPMANHIAVRGEDDPNEADGPYARALPYSMPPRIKSACASACSRP